jgi:acyl carrier protein
MRRTVLEDIVMAQISEISGNAITDINHGSLLEDDLGIDSLDSVELIMNLEKELKISVPDNDIEGMKSWRVGTLIDYLYKFVKD